MRSLTVKHLAVDESSRFGEVFWMKVGSIAAEPDVEGDILSLESTGDG